MRIWPTRNRVKLTVDDIHTIRDFALEVREMKSAIRELQDSVSALRLGQTHISNFRTQFSGGFYSIQAQINTVENELAALKRITFPTL